MLRKIGVVGAGTMGRGIAQIAATFGHDVILYDASEKVINQARDFLLKILNRLAEKGRITDIQAKEIFSRIFFSSSFSAYADCELVIEAIVEKLEIKKAVFSQLEEVVGPDCIIASNTSSLSIASIAGGCTRPGRILGMHFFNPAPLMKLVEVIPAIQTEPEVIRKSMELIHSWEKTVVKVKDTPGFIVNRVARPFYGEALRILEESIADVSTIDWAMVEIGGFRMGPFALMDYIGNDVNYAVTESVFRAFYQDPRYKPAFTQKRLVEAGWLGKKSGRGYYDYAENAKAQLPEKDDEMGKAIVRRIVTMLVNEAADAVFWNIAAPEDIDLAMTKGVNYPKGLLAWADEIGIEQCVREMDRLYDMYREDRYRCSPLLRKMAASGRKFHN